MISAARWVVLEPLLDAALDQPPHLRDAFLVRACGDDMQLRSELDQLLLEMAQPDDELESGVDSVGATLLNDEPIGAPDIPAVLAGRYRIERELGSGGMGVVLLATDLRQHRQVALKVLRPDVARTIGAARFVREIEIAGKLTHPHILPLYEAGESDGFAYFVMPLVAESLRDRLNRESQLPIPDATRIAREVGMALAHAHQEGFIHRDIKPENILLMAGHALVADFGIARAMDAGDAGKLTQTGMALGTPHYMSPEAATGSAGLDGRSDQYSLACVLYEMLTGAPPFSGRNAQVLLSRHLLDPVPPARSARPTVTEAMDDVLRRALAKSAADRFASAADFVEALDVAQAMRERPAVARRSRARAQAAVAALLLTAAAIGYALVTRTSDALPAKTRVLVSVYENRTGNPVLNTVGDAAADYLTRGLAETGLVEVVDARTESAGASAVPGAAGVRTLGRQSKAAQVVWGAYYLEADSLRFETQITDVQTGNDVRPVPSVRGPVANPTTGAERLRQRVMASFAASRDSDFVHFQLVSQPARYDAYQAYRAGMAAPLQTTYGSSHRCDSCLVEALAHFDRAVALDSQFVTAAVAAVSILVETERCAEAEVRNTRIRSQPMAPLDAANLAFEIAPCRADWEANLVAARQRVSLLPNNPGYRFEQASVAMTRDRPREALEALGRISKHARDSLGSAYTRVAVLAHHRRGEHKLGLKLIRETRPPSLDEDAAWFRVEMRELAALGEIAELNQRVDERVRVTSANVIWDTGQDMMTAAAELRAHGYTSDATALYERAVTWYRERSGPLTTASASGWSSLAEALYRAGRIEEARGIYRRLLDETATDSMSLNGAWLGWGVTSARLGDRAAATRVDQWLEQGVRASGAGGALFARARLAALLGDKQRAVDLLTRLTARGGGFAGMHVEADFESLRGFKPWDDLRLIRG